MRKLTLSFLAFILVLGVSGTSQAGSIKTTNNDFGDVYITEEVSATQTVKLNRVGGPPTVTINTVGGVEGPNAGDFAIEMDGDGCTGAVLPGPCNIVITFTPGGFFTRLASIVINATGAGNTDPPGDTDPVTAGNFTLELTGNGTGCGDGVLQPAFETCDFEAPVSAGCCSGDCEADNDTDPCNNECLDGGTGTCSGGFCDGTPVADGTECDADNLCFESGTCQGGACEPGEPVVCPEAPECKVALGCNPDEGCITGDAPAGTACGGAGSDNVCDGSGNCVAPGVNLSITKTAAPNPAQCAQDVVYTVTVTNNGPEDATGVEVTDSIPAGLAFISVTASQGGCNNALPPLCNLGDLAVGDSATIEVTVQPTAEGTIVNTATASSDQSGPVDTEASLEVSGGNCGGGGGGGCALSSLATNPGSLMGLWAVLVGIGLAARMRRRG